MSLLIKIKKDLFAHHLLNKMIGLFFGESNFPKEILKKIPDFPNFMDRANYALQLISEGKLNLSLKNDKGLEIEKMKMKNLRNNIFLSIFSIVIVTLLVF